MNEFFSQDIILENEFVKLVPFSETYHDDLKKIIFDEEITKYTGNHIKTEVDSNNYIIRTMESRLSKTRYPFIIIEKQTNTVVGSTSYGNINFGSKRLEIGWTWFGKPYRGTGLNVATKYEMLKYAFEVLNFNRVQFSVDSENIRSQKAVLKLGASQEGIFRNNYENALGEARDDVYFSIIKSEWELLKTTIFNKFISK